MMVRGIIDAFFYTTFYADIATKLYDICVKHMGCEYDIQPYHKLSEEWGDIFMSKKCASHVLFTTKTILPTTWK